MSNKNIINPDEIKEFYENLEKIIEDVDCDNPLKVYSFANSLINMGNYFLSKAYSQLVTKSYTVDELKEFQS